MLSALRVFAIAALLSSSSLAAPNDAPVQRDIVQRGINNAATDKIGSLVTPTPLKKRALTNGERLARGLPLNPPHKRHNRRHLQPSGTPTQDGPTPQPTPVNPGKAYCMPRDGIVEIIDGDSNVLGYLGDVTTQFGQYGYCPEREKAMKVHANCDGDRFNLMTVGIDGAFSFLGGITGLDSLSADLLPGSLNYAYFGGVTSTSPGKPACQQENSFTKITNIQNTVESAIWSLDDDSNLLTPHWTNTDGTEEETHVAFHKSLNVLYFTGDLNEFNNSIPDEDVVKVSFRLTSA